MRPVSVRSPLILPTVPLPAPKGESATISLNSLSQARLSRGRRAQMGQVFISHSHKDRAFVERLANDLGANGLDVWYSEWQMKPGDSLTQKVAEGIKSSGSMIIVLS